MRLPAAILALLLASPAYAQSKDVLIEIDRGRTEGVFTKTPVFQRAILSLPAAPTDTALLFFRGMPGIARIRTLEDKSRNLNWIRPTQQLFLDAGIALVVMDCPTDQWGIQGPKPTSCYDDYRSSKQHADDVRAVMAKLREHGLSRFFIAGHSLGTISSRWLAVNLGKEIAGSIHSGAMNNMSPRAAYGTSASRIPMGEIAAPVLNVHNANDACPNTPYAMVKAYSNGNLVTVHGGIPEGDPCGGGHLHSLQGREEAAARAVIDWIKTGNVQADVGND